ncbi:MAG: T9SS type A sorting domain-containing protein [Crocinitomicaceae bacterium]|nr:T9SS type A sorting domain-containing protein [Crocinitomicaceae bacterium]
MKKTLLLGALAITTYGSAQMTQANEPAINDIESMFLCDSFTVNLDGVVGAGVTWDYTGLVGHFNEMRDVEVVDPTSTPFAVNFGSATSAIIVGGSITTYYSSTPTEKTSHGFTFNEPTFGDVIAEFSGNPEIVATYPFTEGDVSDDTFSGNILYLGGVSVAATGVSHAVLDGEGTLDLPNAVSLSNVLRYKLVDTSWATITIPIALGDMEFIRTQYEYYDYTVSNLPVFIHSTIRVQNVGATAPVSELTLVLSKYAPGGYVGVEEAELIDFAVYPNPSTGLVKVSGTLSDEATVTVLDQSGRVLISSDISNGDQLDLSTFENGMYIVRINDNGLSTTKSVIKQ